MKDINNWTVKKFEFKRNKKTFNKCANVFLIKYKYIGWFIDFYLLIQETMI